MKQYFIFLLIVPLSSFLTKYISHPSLQPGWCGYCLQSYCCVSRWCMRTTVEKMENGTLSVWNGEDRASHWIESSRKSQKSKLSAIFLPNLVALLLALVPVWAKSFNPALEKTIELNSIGWLTIIIWLCGLVMTAVAVWMDRQPTAVINNDSDVNLNYTRARKNIWKNFWLIVLWLNTAFAAVILAASFLADNMGWMILTGSMVYALQHCFCVFR